MPLIASGGAGEMVHFLEAFEQADVDGALADLIGLDTCLAIMDVLYHELRDSKYRACPLLVQMVDAGQFGRKTAKGFYGYES